MPGSGGGFAGAGLGEGFEVGGVLGREEVADALEEVIGGEMAGFALGEEGQEGG